MRTFRLSGEVAISYNSGPSRLRHAYLRQIRRSISSEKPALSRIMPPRYKNWVICLYLWPAASMTSGGAGDVWSGVRSSIVSVLFSDTVRPAASKTVTMAVIILAKSLDRLRGTSCVIGVQHAPHRPLHAWQWHLSSDHHILEVNQFPHDVFVLAEPC